MPVSRGAARLAERRTEAAGLFWTEFRQAAVEELVVDRPFDATIGCHLLARQADPVAFLRSAAGIGPAVARGSSRSPGDD